MGPSTLSMDQSKPAYSKRPPAYIRLICPLHFFPSLVYLLIQVLQLLLHLLSHHPAACHSLASTFLQWHNHITSMQLVSTPWYPGPLPLCRFATSHRHLEMSTQSLTSPMMLAFLQMFSGKCLHSVGVVTELWQGIWLRLTFVTYS